MRTASRHRQGSIADLQKISCVGLDCYDGWNNKILTSDYWCYIPVCVSSESNGCMKMIAKGGGLTGLIFV